MVIIEDFFESLDPDDQMRIERQYAHARRHIRDAAAIWTRSLIKNCLEIGIADPSDTLVRIAALADDAVAHFNWFYSKPATL